MKKCMMIIVLGLSLAACSERNPPRNENGSGLPGNEQRTDGDDNDNDGNHGDDDTRSEQNDRSN